MQLMYSAGLHSGSKQQRATELHQGSFDPQERFLMTAACLLCPVPIFAETEGGGED